MSWDDETPSLRGLLDYWAWSIKARISNWWNYKILRKERVRSELLTVSMITNAALKVLENDLTFAGQCNTEYDDDIRIHKAGMINIRRPARFLSTEMTVSNNPAAPQQ